MLRLESLLKLYDSACTYDFFCVDCGTMTLPINKEPLILQFRDSKILDAGCLKEGLMLLR